MTYTKMTLSMQCKKYIANKSSSMDSESKDEKFWWKHSGYVWCVRWTLGESKMLLPNIVFI